MDKAIAICLTALLLLSGCLDASDDDDLVSIIGCDDEASLTYNQNATESNDELCASEDLIESAIVDFINMMDEGPDFSELDSTIGYTMEISETQINMTECYEWEYWNPDLVDESMPYNGCPDATEEVWHYMETVVVNPTGYKVTSENTLNGDATVEELIISGNQIQYTMIEDGESMQVRMKHAGTYEDVIDAMMNGGGDDEDMDDMMVCHDMSTHTNDYSIDNQEDCEDAGYIWTEDTGHSDDGDAEMVCYDMGSHMVLYDIDNAEDCEDGDYMWVEADSGSDGHSDDDHGDDDGMDMGDDDEDPESSDYTDYFNPLTATFTGFEKTESGMTFSGLLNVEGAPFGLLEVYTLDDFTVTGFALMDVENSANWAKFMLIYDGSTSVDQTLALDALPFVLVDFDMSDDESDEDEDLVDNDNDGYDETQDCDDNDPWIYPDNPEEEIDGLDNDCDGLIDYEDDNCGECWDELWFAFTDLSADTESNTSLDQILEYQSTYWRATAPDADSQTPFGIAFSEMSAEDVELIFKEVDTDESSTLDESEMAEFHNQIQDQIWDEYNGESDDHDGHDDGHDDDEIPMYRCINFVDESVLDSTANFSSVFNNSNLDYSLCDTSAEDVNYTFENSNFTLPTHMMYESCWEEEPNVTMCDYGIIEAVNGSELYNTYAMEDNESADDCDGEYKNESNLCTEWEGNITDSDANAFTISGEDETILFYQYDSQLSSGIIIMVSEEYNDDYDGEGEGDWSFDRELQDCDSDNDTMVSYDELETCIDEDLANDGYGHMSASDVHAYDEFNMSDMDNDGMLNDSEFDYLNSMLSHDNEGPNYEEMFNMMDSDEDGEVTFSEWQDMNNQSDEPMPQDELDRFALIINFFDEDNSGGLDLSEFENMMYTLDSEDDGMDEDPEFMFAMLDSNSDGEVTLDEWVASSNNSDEGPMSQEDIDGLSNMMDMFDEDDSMGLNFSEFKAMMETMDNGDMEDNPEFLFAMIDANDDGEVTASEWADASNQSEDEEPMSDEEFEMFSAMINSFDSDSSGGLDFEEFMKMMEDMDGEGDDMSDKKMLMVMGLDNLGGDLDDYSLVLSQCDQFQHYSGLYMQNENCGDDVYSVKLSSIALSEQEAMFSTQSIIFMDMDESGTLTTGDMFMIDTSSLDVEGDWNAARLHSEEADAYSDENPMAMPGFTGILATIGLLGAALIRRD